MINITKAYIKNGKILMDGKNDGGTTIHQVVSIPFSVDESKQIFTITGSVEFMEDMINFFNRSFKK